MSATQERAAVMARFADVSGLPDVVVARMFATEAAEASREERRREAERALAVERHEAAALAHAMACREVGMPEGTSVAEYVAAMNPTGDGAGRNPDAPLGSADRPFRWASTSGGGLIALDGPPGGQAQRSFTETLQDAQVARWHEHQRDGFMLTMRSQARSRRAREAIRQEAAARSAHVPTGTGWPEQYPEISR